MRHAAGCTGEKEGVDPVKFLEYHPLDAKVKNSDP